MKFKREALSPALTIIAMTLLLISRLLSDDTSMDWLGYLAITVMITAIVSLFLIYKKSK
ncbi:hypothetical protein HSX10_08065 [Winogradskyella undariae]|uniref:hypothetical protein n=1 Tax=Winogradskyella TaxID=286104 RepID=UPI00156B91DB|nr:MULTISPECIES: hypothetical protein [Winogradskyella]NRR91517.1 hypothetical protein [Winogradskyella undariae]QXP80635.1 hypothetical protein H0I32_08470 [Winogradskyella sp. HaHa_3_26]